MTLLLQSSVMDSMLNRKSVTYNFKTLQKLWTERKTAAFYDLETLTYFISQLWTLLPKDKHINTISFSKRDAR